MADEAAEVEETVSDAQLMTGVKAREAEVIGFLSKKDKVNALKASLRDPPVVSKSEEIKVRTNLILLIKFQ
jgi:hypothetical protein